MKILVISDNHGYVDEGILHHAAWADEVWHAGDWLNTMLHEAIMKLGKPIIGDRKSTRLNSSHVSESRMPSSA